VLDVSVGLCRIGAAALSSSCNMMWWRATVQRSQATRRGTLGTPLSRGSLVRGAGISSMHLCVLFAPLNPALPHKWVLGRDLRSLLFPLLGALAGSEPAPQDATPLASRDPNQEQVNGQVINQVDGTTNNRMNNQMNGGMNGHTNGPMNGQRQGGGPGPAANPRPQVSAPPPAYSAKGPVARNEAAPRVVPIFDLNPYMGKWTIKARVTNKGTVRRYNNAKGGKVMSFEILDAQGGDMKVTAFNNELDAFADRIEVRHHHGFLHLVCCRATS